MGYVFDLDMECINNGTLLVDNNMPRSTSFVFNMCIAAFHSQILVKHEQKHTSTYIK